MLGIAAEVEHHFIGGVYLKRMHLPAGETALTHKHNFEHATILAQGTATIALNDNRETYVGPCVIAIPANCHHQIAAITDTTWFCVHRTDIADPAQIDETLIVKEGG